MTRIALVVWLSILACPSAATAQNLEQQERALKVISEFANSLCDRIKLEGGSQSFATSGTAKVEIGKLVGKLASLNIGGAAKYTDIQYQNVLQKDLATSLEGSRNCKKDIADKLIDKMILKSPGSLGSDQSVGIVGSQSLRSRDFFGENSTEWDTREDASGTVKPRIIRARVCTHNEVDDRHYTPERGTCDVRELAGGQWQIFVTGAQRGMKLTCVVQCSG